MRIEFVRAIAAARITMPASMVRLFGRARGDERRGSSAVLPRGPPIRFSAAKTATTPIPRAITIAS